MDNKAHPQPVSSGIFIPRVEYREFTLDNGLKVVLSKSDKIPSVVINTTFHVGAKDEDQGKSGLAHLFEHLLFEGTANTTSGEFDKLLTERGGESNAYTTMDSTSYYTVVPSNQFEFALWLDSDRMAGFGIDQQSLDIQKQVVLEEKMTVYDNSPYGSLEEESSIRLFKGTNYGKMIIGSAVDVESVTLKEIKGFWERYYHPSNAVLSIVGDIEYDSAEELIRKYYGDLPALPHGERKSFDYNEITSEIRDVLYDDVQIPGVFIFYKLPKIGSAENYALKILNSLLNDGDSSRFYKRLIHEKGLVSEIDSAVYEMEDVGMLSITAYGYPDTEPSLIEEEIYNILDEIMAGEFTGGELTKVKNKVETSFSSRRLSIINLADKLSQIKTFYGDTELINTEINYYLNVTRDDIISAAKKYLNHNQRVVLTYLPKNA
ncbi:MAG TPA: pitrilysin family protein [Ignavibacteria bacterium]|nr:pitrilysin family protein [Ignavibacteria bacterium]